MVALFFYTREWALSREVMLALFKGEILIVHGVSVG